MANPPNPDAFPADWGFLPEAAGGPCRFCERPAIGLFTLRMRMPDPGPDASEYRREEARHIWTMATALCLTHKRVIEQAGERGRVHGPSRIRYWLLPSDQLH